MNTPLGPTEYSVEAQHVDKLVFVGMNYTPLVNVYVELFYACSLEMNI